MSTQTQTAYSRLILPLLIPIIKKNYETSHSVIIMDSHLSIGYLVIPPGCGKSTLHHQELGLIEADTLVPYNSTKELRSTRENARLTGDWTAYDRTWSTLLGAKLPQGRCVIMVPKKEVGESLGGEYLGTLYLEDKTWQANTASRGVPLSKYKSCLPATLDAWTTRYKENKDLQQAVRSRFSVWKDIPRPQTE